jgi:hypothetical protein
MALPLELYTSCASMLAAKREVLPCHDTTRPGFRNIFETFADGLSTSTA